MIRYMNAAELADRDKKYGFQLLEDQTPYRNKRMQ